eukprot:g36964.t1
MSHRSLDKEMYGGISRSKEWLSVQKHCDQSFQKKQNWVKNFAAAEAIMASFCGNCGSTLGAVKFCSQCGTKVSQAQDSKQTSGVVHKPNDTNGLNPTVQAPRDVCTVEKEKDTMTWMAAKTAQPVPAGGTRGGGGTLALSTLGPSAQLQQLKAKLAKAEALEAAWKAGDAVLGPGDFPKIDGIPKLRVRIAELESQS